MIFLIQWFQKHMILETLMDMTLQVHYEIRKPVDHATLLDLFNRWMQGLKLNMDI